MTGPSLTRAGLVPRVQAAWTKASVPFASLAVPNFRYLWFGQVGSAVAMHADTLARSWLTWQLTGSFTAVAGVSMARGVPTLFFGLFGGLAADRFDRRKALMIIQTWTLIMHATMAAIIISGLVQIWHVYALAFLLGISQSMNQPVRTSIIPQLVGRRRMLNAITLHSIAINGTRFLGPAAIAFVIGLAGVGSAYIVSASVYVIVLWTTTKIEIPDMPQSGAERLRGQPVGRLGSVRELRQLLTSLSRQLVEGFRFIVDNRLILTIVLLGVGPLSIGMAYRSLLPGLITNVLHADVELLGIVQSAAAAGSLAAGLYLASRVFIPRKGAVMVAVTGTYGLALMGIAGAGFLWMVIPLMIATSMSQTVFRAANTTALLEMTPDRLRGRVVSATLINQALSPVAGIAAGVIADHWGIGAGFLFLGTAILAVLALAVALYPKIRHA